MASLDFDSLDIAQARHKLGTMWGLGRPLTRAELGRALMLSEKYGGEHVSKLETGKANLSGPIYACICMMLAGAVPPGMESVVKPGYPRGEVR